MTYKKNLLRSLHLSCILLLVSQYTGLTVSHADADPAPDFSFKNGTEGTRLSSLKGHVVYLDFWASWCTPCRKSFPWMNELQSQYGDSKLTVIAVNLDQKREDAREFLEKTAPKFKIIYDPQGKVAELYKVKAMPSSYLIDREGNLVMSKLGFKINEKADVEEKIKSLLSKE